MTVIEHVDASDRFRLETAGMRAARVHAVMRQVPALAGPMRPRALVAARPVACAALTPRRSRLLSSTASGSSSSDASPDAAAADAKPEQEAPTTAEAEAAATVEGDESAASDEPTEDPVEQLTARIAELEEEVKGKHDQVLRALAEAENARRRAAIDVENAHKFSIGKFAKALLDVADNLNRAAEAVPEEARASDDQPTLKALYEGVVMTETVLINTFEKHGLVKLWPMDEKFDPNMHNALFEMPDPDREPGTVAHVASAGYVLHDRCIRPADVGIVSKPS